MNAFLFQLGARRIAPREPAKANPRSGQNFQVRLRRDFPTKHLLGRGQGQVV